MRVQRLEVFGLLLTLAWCVGCGDSEGERGAVVNNGAADASNGDATDSNGTLACAAPPVACGVDGEASPFGWGQVESWEIDGDLAYLVVPDKGIEIIDLSSQEPVRVGELPLPGVVSFPSDSARRIMVDGGLAYTMSEVRVGEEEVPNLEIIDVSDPSAPSVLSSTPVSGLLCAVGEGFVLVDGPSEGQVIDVSDPQVPIVAGSLPLSCGGTTLLVGSTLFLMDDERAETPEGLRLTIFRLIAVDLSDPGDPREVDHLDFEVTGWLAAQARIAHTDAGLVVTFSTQDMWGQEGPGREFLVIDVTDPTNLALLNTSSLELPVPEEVTLEFGEEGLLPAPEMIGEGSRLYLSTLALDAALFHAIEVSPTGALTVLGTELRRLDEFGGALPETHPFFRIDVEGGLMRHTDGWSLITLDFSDPTQPTVAPDVTLGRHRPDFSDVALSGGVAYVAAGDAGLRVFDVGCPSRPVEVGAIGAGFVAVVADANGFAYASTGSSVHVIDATNPSAPVERAVFDVAVHDMALIDQHLYVVGDGVLRILDVSDPDSPAELGSYAASAEPSGSGLNNQLAVSPDGVAYVTLSGERPTSLHILDVSNPASPTPLAPPVELGLVIEIGLVRSLLFIMDVAGDNPGFRVLDVWDPNNVTERLAHPLTQYTPFTIEGDRLAIRSSTATTDGFALYQVNDLDGALEEIATFDVAGNRAALDGDTMVVTTYLSPLAVVGIACE